MVKVSFGRPCHVPPCLINEERGSTYLVKIFVLRVLFQTKHGLNGCRWTVHAARGLPWRSGCGIAGGVRGGPTFARDLMSSPPWGRWT